MLKLIALGTLGYLGYRYYTSRDDDAVRQDRSDDEVRLAGGPLSDNARVVHPSSSA